MQNVCSQKIYDCNLVISVPRYCRRRELSCAFAVTSLKLATPLYFELRYLWILVCMSLYCDFPDTPWTHVRFSKTSCAQSSRQRRCPCCSAQSVLIAAVLLSASHWKPITSQNIVPYTRVVSAASESSLRGQVALYSQLFTTRLICPAVVSCLINTGTWADEAGRDEDKRDCMFYPVCPRAHAARRVVFDVVLSILRPSCG